MHRLKSLCVFIGISKRMHRNHAHDFFFYFYTQSMHFCCFIGNHFNIFDVKCTKMIYFFLFLLCHTDNFRPFYAEAHRTITIYAIFFSHQIVEGFPFTIKKKKWIIFVSTFRMKTFGINFGKMDFSWLFSMQRKGKRKTSLNSRKSTLIHNI